MWQFSLGRGWTSPQPHSRAGEGEEVAVFSGERVALSPTPLSEGRLTGPASPDLSVCLFHESWYDLYDQLERICL